MARIGWRLAGAVVAAVVAAVVGAAAVSVSPGIGYAESNGGVRVMPLGDSITDGFNVPGGYRIGLWQRLAGGGYTVDFVGSSANGPPELGDHDHEGHSGWRIDQIDANIVGWLHASAPHMVLLHIGTNDVNQNYDVANAPARLSTLVDHILRVYGTSCLDVYGAGTGNGTSVIIWPCHGGANQRWEFRPDGSVRAVGAGRCLDVTGSGTANATQIQIYECNGTSAQQWAAP